MNISIITWSEGFYDHYMKILKDETIIYYGEGYRIISCETEDLGLELNYGIKNKRYDVDLRQKGNKVYTIPYYNSAFKYDYIYIPVEFNMDEIKRITVKKFSIKKCTVEDIVLSWILTSEFKDYCSNMEEYKKLLSRDIYYVSDERLNENIEERFTELFNMKEGIIEEITDISEYEVIEVYLNKGTVWNAFLKKDNEIYLNTGLSISIKIKF